MRQVRHDAQLDLRIVGRHQVMAGRGDERFADAPSSALRIGMFCRFGSLLDNPPVTAVWLNVVCTRPVRGLTMRGSLSV